MRILSIVSSIECFISECVLEKVFFSHSFIHLANQKSNSIFKINHFVLIHFDVLYIKLASLLSFEPGPWIIMNDRGKEFDSYWLSFFTLSSFRLQTMENYQKLVFAIHLQYFALNSENLLIRWTLLVIIIIIIIISSF